MSQVERFLPMNPVEFLVLVALCDGELHGYGLVRDIADRTGGRVRLRAGNLYRVLDRMLRRGLIEESARRPADSRRGGEVRRLYRPSELGRRVAVAEAELMMSVVARSEGLRLREVS